MVTSWTLLVTAAERWGKAFLKTVFKIQGVGSQDHPYNLLRLILTIHPVTFSLSDSYVTRPSLALELGQDSKTFFQPVDRLFPSPWGPSSLGFSPQTSQQPRCPGWLEPTLSVPPPLPSSSSPSLPLPFRSPLMTFPSPTPSLLFPPSLFFPILSSLLCFPHYSSFGQTAESPLFIVQYQCQKRESFWMTYMLK